MSKTFDIVAKGCPEVMISLSWFFIKTLKKEIAEGQKLILVCLYNILSSLEDKNSIEIV